jgi:hypothetical protein
MLRDRETPVRAILGGMAAGVVGAAVMTAIEKVEQRVTGRPNSYVPARTLAHLLRLRKPDEDRWARNMAMHYGTGALVGVVRGVMGAAGLRGPWAATLFTPLRLTVDQTLENATGVGAPPWTWPRDELVIDVAHKAVYALVTGAAADRLTAAPHSTGSSSCWTNSSNTAASRDRWCARWATRPRCCRVISISREP